MRKRKPFVKLSRILRPVTMDEDRFRDTLRDIEVLSQHFMRVREQIDALKRTKIAQDLNELERERKTLTSSIRERIQSINFGGGVESIESSERVEIAHSRKRLAVNVVELKFIEPSVFEELAVLEVDGVDAITFTIHPKVLNSLERTEPELYKYLVEEGLVVEQWTAPQVRLRKRKEITDE